MKLLLPTLFLFSLSAQAITLNCEAWEQKANQELVKKKMDFTGIQADSNDEMYRAELNSIQYRVDWSKQLDTLYASVVFNLKSHIFATVRVPDLSVHNDAFLDFTNDQGDRVSISCNVTQ